MMKKEKRKENKPANKRALKVTNISEIHNLIV